MNITTSIFCKTCNNVIGKGELFTFYQQSTNGYHFTNKVEKRNDLLKNLQLESQKEEKQKKFIPFIVLCIGCKTKLGSDTLCGPRGEAVFCLKAEAIYAIHINADGKKQRHDFTKKTKWSDMIKVFKDIETRSNLTFYGSDANGASVNRVVDTSRFLKTNLPNIDEVSRFNIASLTFDMPRTYQIEMYLAALSKNTIVYLPTGAGKTMVGAMVAAYMKKTNPDKKVFFVCDRIPLVFQQGEYLKAQIDLTVGEFCSESKGFVDSQLGCDIHVQTCGFLINLLCNNTVFLEECCCLIIDEIHHAQAGHLFTQLIEKFYWNVDEKYRPLILGLTASPSATANTTEKITAEVKRLCELIKGQIYMPHIYLEDLKKVVNRPELQFYETESDDNETHFLNLLSDYIKSLVLTVNSTYAQIIDLKSQHTQNTLRNFINNSLEAANISQDTRNFTIVSLIQKLLNAQEILTIVGLTKSVEFVKDCIKKQIEYNSKEKILKQEEIERMSLLSESISYLNGESDKIRKLFFILKNKENFNNDSRAIIFVRRRKTARCVCDYLSRDRNIKTQWNPHVFVGHASGTGDGMDWFEEQEPVLNFFRDGTCRLLVSTNVLQEGLDVPVCDMVILFDKMWSVTEYVQSRGRARNKQSKFIIIGSVGERQDYEKLVRAERELTSIVQTRMLQEKYRLNEFTNSRYGLNEFTSERTVNYLINLSENTEKVDGPRGLSHVRKDIKTSFQLYVKDNELIIYRLFNLLKTIKGYAQSDVINQSFLAEKCFDDRRIYNCLFELRNCRIKIEENKFGLEKLINLFPNTNTMTNEYAVYWFPPKTKESTRLSKSFMCKKVRFGNLTTPFEFVVPPWQFFDTFPDSSVRIIIKHDMKCILLLFVHNNLLYKFEIDFESIDDIVCVGLHGTVLKIYIPLKRAPFIYSAPSVDANTQSKLQNLDEQYLEWERTYLGNIYWSFEITLNAENEKQKLEIIGDIQAIRSLQMIFCCTSTRTLNYSLIDLRNDFTFYDFDTFYALECLISQYGYMLYGKIDHTFAASLNQLSPTKVCKVLERFTLRLYNQRYLSLLPLLESVIVETEEKTIDLINKNFKTVLIRRTIITPSRIIFYFPELNFSNRVTRQYNSDQFLRIRFRDENLSKLNSSQNYSDMTNIYTKIKNDLITGIKIKDRKYEFLAMSASQMREHGCWLFCQLDLISAEMVREWMGDFSGIRCIGKYAARLGQSLSSSIEAFVTDEFKTIPDIEVKIGDKTYCFTDGIGKISMNKAKEISKQYYGKEYASAFQIRFAGYKGVVAADPTLTTGELQFRESMKKFDSEYNRLDVLNVAEHIPCFLNRQVITILSALGIQDSVFSDLQDLMFKELGDIFVKNSSAIYYLQKFYRKNNKQIQVNLNFNYSYEPFFRDLLKTIYKKMLNDLIKKSRIFVKKGRILMGTIDETNSLQANEVFIQCNPSYDLKEEDPYGIQKMEASGTFIVNSKVAVAKNPCMHPGDIRILNAVDRPKLRHMVDCIVFPAKGPRPITNMCSGSDLDGDLYFVTWEPLLIPDHMEEPMDYISPKAKNKDSEIRIDDVITFFVDFIENDQLGRIANAHVALSDQKPEGVKHPICIKLAEAFSLAVDFPKHGVVVTVPPEARKVSYPDFLEKSGNSYESQKIIGKMYRKCKNLYFNDLYTDPISLNRSLLHKGYDNYVSEATKTYEIYRIEIERIMVQFECEKESELFIGTHLNNNNNNDDSRNVFRLSNSAIGNLWEHMRKVYVETVEKELKEPIHKTTIQYQIASAWYYACYTHKGNEKKRILSFPWIIEDVLLQIKFKNYDTFSHSVVKNYCEYRDRLQSVSSYVQYMGLRTDISDLLKINIILCGLTGLFLTEEGNEIRFFVHKKPNENIKIDKKMKFILEEHFDCVSFNNGVLRCEDSEITFTISDSKIAILRFLYIRKCIFNKPELLAFLFTILHFAKAENLFIALKSDNIGLDRFVEFCVNYCIKHEYIDNISENEINNDFNELDEDDYDEFTKWMTLQDQLFDNAELDSNNFGQALLNFYKDLAYNTNNIIISSKFEATNVKLNDKSNEILRNHAFTLYNLLITTTDISHVWSSVITNEPTFKKNYKLSRKKGKSKINFMENSSLMLFSNFKNDLDLVEFCLYNGPRRSVHKLKQCYSAKVISQDKITFTNECYKEYHRHSMQQFLKAREMNSDFSFRFQVKFGDIYFSNIPTNLLEESLNTPYYKLIEALQRSYRSFSFSYQKTKKDPIIIDKGSNENENEILEIFEEISRLNEDDEDDDVEDDDGTNDLGEMMNDMYDYDEVDESHYIKKKKKKKKKKLISFATSSFNTSIQNDLQYLHSIFIDNEFERKATENYVVYIEMNNVNNDREISYRVKYDSNIQFVKMLSFPIKWLSIDIRNQCEKSEKKTTRDMRFSLISDKIILEQDENNNTSDSDYALNEKIKAGIIARTPQSSNELIVNEDFRNSSVFVRHAKGIKYRGNVDNWKSVFNRSGIKIPKNFPFDILERFSIAILETDEYSDSDEHGLFTFTSEEKEFFITYKMEGINTMKNSDMDELIVGAWWLARAFERILE